MYDKILFPTDGSDGAAEARAHAQHLADLHDSEFHVLFVVDTSHIGIESGTADDIHTKGERVVEAVSDELTSQGHTVFTHIREGIPHKEIVDIADAEGMDLIVMGTHGRSGLDRYVVGSVTENVVRHADPPVFTVRMSDT